MSEHLVTTTAKLTDASALEPHPTSRRLSRRQLILRRFVRNKTAVVGLAVVLGMIIVALIGPYVSPWAFDQVDRRAYLKPPSDR
ncbi:MAG: hypothetical protein ACLGIF_08850, partial [Actinomycetes bacterium]